MRNRERAAGQKIILHIDDDQRARRFVFRTRPNSKAFGIQYGSLKFLGMLDLEHRGDPVARNAIARGFNRAMVDFCSVDRRLLASCYVPLADFDEAAAIAREAIALGAKALLIPSRCPKGHSPSHIALDPVWAQAQEAGLPILFHVGGGGQLISSDYFKNGMPPVPDFHGGDGNFRSVDYMAIPNPPMQTLATMILEFVNASAIKYVIAEQTAQPSRTER